MRARHWTVDMTVKPGAIDPRHFGSRLAGGALLVSVPLWLGALRWWASSQHGYLDVDAIGPSPFVWLLLMGVGGLALAIGALPRATIGGAVAVLGFLLLAGALAAVNLAAAAGGDISPAGWMIAVFSVGQVAVFVAGVAGGWMHRRR
jgi:hypothetical protein